ncbi:MAG TPA: hypothetical protein VFJ02_07350, partial [Vicinamibacterales bacterium]|nr:hypothetical protein [Vicinamibacterales bacterium]
MRRAVIGVGVTALLVAALAAQPQAPRGAREPAWSPDGKRLAFSYLDRIWMSNPDGRNARPLRPLSTQTERDPAWSPDGKSIVFAADDGQGFNLVVAAAAGGDARTVTTLAGDERWPSWTADGRIVFSHRSAVRWRLHVVAASGGDASPLFDDTADDDERDGKVSPDGTRVAYVSDRESDDGDADIWVADLKRGPRDRVTRTRVVQARGVEAFPAWSPDGLRIAYFAVREGVGSVWVMGVEEVSPPADAAAPRARPTETPVLVSRRGGSPAWSPDGKKIAIANLPPPDPTYNGNPERNTDDPP